MNKMNLFLAVTLGLLLSAQAFAGDADSNYTLRIGDGDGTGGSADASCGVGETATVAVSLDSADGVKIVAWSMGMCHDNTVVHLNDTDDIQMGSAVSVFDDGDGPEFHGLGLVAGQGWTIGAIISLSGGNDGIEPGNNHEMYLVTYTADAVGSSDLTFCEISNPPSPPVQVVVNDGTNDIAPTLGEGTFQVLAGPPPFTFSIADQEVSYGEGATSASFDAVVSVAQTGGGGGIETQGFSMGISNNDAEVDYVAPLATPIGALAQTNDGDGPDFFGINQVAGGLTIGCVYVISGAGTLVFSGGDGDAVIELHMQSSDGFITGNPESCDTSTLGFSDSLGTPIVPNVVVADGGKTSYTVPDGSLAVDGGDISFCLQVDVPYVSGDCNDDAREDIADAIFALNHLFHPPGQAAPPPDCERSCDVNGDGKFNQADAIFILFHQFLDGPAPEGPANCGDAVVESELTCSDSHTSCD